jgi:hypothetical protein
VAIRSCRHARRRETAGFRPPANPGSALALDVLRGKSRVVVRSTVGEAPAMKRKN